MMSLTLSEIYRVLGVEFDGEDREIKGISTDSRSVNEDEVFFCLVGEKFDAHDFLKDIKCAAAVCQREVGELSFPVIQTPSTVVALGKVAKYHAEKADLRLTLSLTGSVGKTTTKEFCALVLSEKFKTRKTEGNLNNHIGVPKTLLSLSQGDEALVCEMGMSARGEISYLAGLVKSDIAIITNIGHSHIENLKTRENIALAKLEILEGLKSGGVLIVNGDEPLLDDISTDARVVRVGFSQKCEVRAEDVHTFSDRVEFTAYVFQEMLRVTLPCAGRHNVYNALFALAAASVAGIPLDDAASSFKKYVPAGMRQLTYEKRGVLVVADCYNAGIESMCAALETLRDIKGERSTVAVLGDMLELGDSSEEFHRTVGKKAAECQLDAVFAFGNYAEFIAVEARACGVEDVRFFKDKKSCAEALGEYINKNSAILFKASRGMRCEEIISLSGLSEN